MKSITNKELSKKSKNILIKWGFSKKGIINNKNGEWYLFSQLLLILLHILPYWPKNEYILTPIKTFLFIVGLTISINGLIITVRAFIDLGDNLSPLTYPMKESLLVRTNSYRNSRHPLYKGLLYISLGISIVGLSLLHLFLFISLTFILKAKALKEEEKLKVKYKEYKKYIKKVPAIIKNISILDWRT